MRILYVGSLHPKKTCYQRMIALRELGHDVVGIDTDAPAPGAEVSWRVRLAARAGYPPDLANANASMIRHAGIQPYDVVWVTKGLSIAPSTLSTIKTLLPACRLVCYSGDDMLNRANQSRRYVACLPLYDLHVTTKSYNVGELKALGAREVLFVGNAYDPQTHRPLLLTAEEQQRWGSDIGFIGGFEQERYRSLLSLADAGLKVVVRCYTDEWRDYAKRHPNLEIVRAETWGDNYARSISGTKINLSFLRKANRDLQTTRSIEIPACQGFMLAERSTEHQQLFHEGIEAEFFGDDAELLEKTRFYLLHPDKRDAIRLAGRERCLTGGYSNHGRLQQVLARLMKAHVD